MNKLFLSVFILCNLAIAIFLIWALSPLEPFVHHQFFPHYAEAEIQTYMLGIGIFFVFQILFYPLIRTHVSRQVHIKEAYVWLPIWMTNVFLLVGAYHFILFVRSSNDVQAILWWMGMYHIGEMTIWDFVIGEVFIVSSLFLMLPKIRWSKYGSIIVHILALSIIFWLTTGIEKLNLYDYTHYAGPVHDLLMNRPILTFRSWYGFFPILILAALFRVIPLTATNLHVVIAVIEFLGFVLFYKFLMKVLGSLRLALFGTVYAILGNHLVAMHGANEHPQDTFIRIGIWLVVAVLVLYQSRLEQKFGDVAKIIPFLAVSLSVFWTLDFGLYTLLGYCLYLLVMALHMHIFTFLKKYLRQLVGIFGTVLAVFLSINILYVAWYHVLPMWGTHYFFITNYQMSNHMLPVPDVPALWISVLIPVVTISYLIFQLKKNHKIDSVESAVLFTACVSLTNFIYFLGRTTLNQLHPISLPIFVCLFYLVNIVLDNIRHASVPIIIGVILCMGTILAVPGTFLAYQAISDLQTINPLSTLRLLQHQGENEYDMFGPTVERLRQRYQSEITSNNLTLLSMYDTWYLTLLNTTNRLGINCQLCYIPDENVNFEASNILNSPSQYLFLDTRRTEQEFGGRVASVFSHVQSQYHYVEDLGSLTVYKRN